jgi:hypothetical protein
LEKKFFSASSDSLLIACPQYNSFLGRMSPYASSSEGRRIRPALFVKVTGRRPAILGDSPAWRNETIQVGVAYLAPAICPRPSTRRLADREAIQNAAVLRHSIESLRQLNCRTSVSFNAAIRTKNYDRLSPRFYFGSPSRHKLPRFSGNSANLGFALIRVKNLWKKILKKCLNVRLTGVKLIR